MSPTSTLGATTDLPARSRFTTVDAERSVAFAEVDLEAPGESQVVVRIRYTGVCATDTHGWASGGLIPAAVFGHEWTGTVVAAGSRVTTVAVGDRVVASVGPPCGTCAMCRAGHPDHCDTAFAEANGISPDAPTRGAFAQHVTVHERRVQQALDGLTDEQLGRRAGQRLGSVVVVQGAGPFGLLTAQHARHAGAGAVVIVEPLEARRETARRLGFTDVHAPGEGFTARVLELTDGLGADVLYECTPPRCSSRVPSSSAAAARSRCSATR